MLGFHRPRYSDSGEANFLDEDNTEPTSGTDYHSSGTASGTHHSLPTHEEAVTSFSGHEEAVTSFAEPENNQSDRNHRNENNRNSYIRLDDSDSYLPNSSGLTNGTSRPLRCSSPEEGVDVSKYQSDPYNSSLNSLYTRLDPDDEPDLLSRSSALFSRAGEDDRGLERIREDHSGSGYQNSTGSSKYDKELEDIVRAGRNLFELRRSLEEEEEAEGKSYDNSRDDNGLERTLTFTNRSRSVEDLDSTSSDLHRPTLSHSNSREDVEQDIPIVYNRKDEAPPPGGEQQEEDQEEEEEYKPVYTRERLRELTGEDNFQFTPRRRNRRNRRSRGYTSDDTDYIEPGFRVRLVSVCNSIMGCLKKYEILNVFMLIKPNP